MSERKYFAAKDIKNSQGKVLVKKGDLAVTIKTELDVERFFAGLRVGHYVDEGGATAIKENETKSIAEQRAALQAQLDALPPADGKKSPAAAAKA